MLRRFTPVLPIALAIAPAFAQTAAGGPKFEIAGVHPSEKVRNPFVRNAAIRGSRWEIKQASLLDLIRIAYGFGDDRIVGGPSWIELDRFDVTAKLPEDTADERKEMLQALLKDRFKLVSRKETKPMPAYSLVVAKKPLMKEADGEGESGCKPETAAGSPAEGGIRLTAVMNGGAPMTINLGPGMMLHIVCRNVTMAEFANLRGMFGIPNIGPNPVRDETGLKGKWNFDLRYSMSLIGPAMGADTERISFFDAIEKQLGLKLEQKPVPTEVLVVESANRKPTDDPPGLAEALPPLPEPKEFEVADVKPSDPAGRGGRMQTQPGGRFNVQGMPLRSLVMRAFSDNFMLASRDSIVGLPAWADTERFDITAKAPSAGPDAPPIDNDAVTGMLRALLADRFKMTYHTEERPMPAYSLVASKPKMKKADPNSRTSCKQATGPGAAPPGQMMWTCQNVTMEIFAERLQTMPGIQVSSIKDETGLEGGWDLTLTYSPSAGNAMMMAGRGSDVAAGGGVPAAADPSGQLTIMEAVEKQLGLKLESRKRPMPVIVIDHIEQKPTEN